MFCKECIFEYVVDRKKEIQRAMEQWKIQEEKEKLLAEKKEAEQQQSKIEKFDKTVIGFSIAANAPKESEQKAPDNPFNDPNYKLNAFWVVSCRVE